MAVAFEPEPHSFAARPFASVELSSGGPLAAASRDTPSEAVVAAEAAAAAKPGAASGAASPSPSPSSLSCTAYSLAPSPPVDPPSGRQLAGASRDAPSAVDAASGAAAAAKPGAAFDATAPAPSPSISSRTAPATTPTLVPLSAAPPPGLGPFASRDPCASPIDTAAPAAAAKLDVVRDVAREPTSARVASSSPPSPASTLTSPC